MNGLNNYINSLIPKNISRKKKELLYDELESHLFEKIDYYTKLGFSLDESLEKAKADFAADEKTAESISGGFETLYGERTLWAVIAAVLIVVMNGICFPLDIWVSNVEFNDEPTLFGVTVSFLMIFVVVFGAFFARLKGYRKTLISIGSANLFLLIGLIFMSYPQPAFYAVNSNVIYLIDRFTPIYLGEKIRYGYGWYFWFAVIFLAVIVLCCFIGAYKIKKGSARHIQKPKVGVCVFVSVFVFIAAVTAFMYPVSYEYIENYPYFLDNFAQYLSEETETLYSEIDINSDYAAVTQILTGSGWMSFETFENTLDRTGKKQFEGSKNNFDLRDGYEFWFNPEKSIDGGGFVGIKKDADGKVTGKLIGNIENGIRTKDYGSYGYHPHNNCDMYEMFATFDNLHLGDSQEDVMRDFVNKYGTVYTKLESEENGNKTAYFRIACEGSVDSEEYGLMYDKDDLTVYNEITFKNGELADAKMHYTAWVDGDLKNEIKSVAD